MHKVLSEDDMKREVRKAKIANYTIFAVVLAFLLAIIVGYLVYRYQHTFHSDKWLNEPSERTDMIDNLLHNYEIVGLTETEVLSLLGPHDNAQGLSLIHISEKQIKTGDSPHAVCGQSIRHAPSAAKCCPL